MTTERWTDEMLDKLADELKGTQHLVERVQPLVDKGWYSQVSTGNPY
jgi:hypothetical protein